MKQKNKRGGKRAGAGSKKKYNEPTKTISFRCPESKLTEMKEIISGKLYEWLPK